MVWKHKYLHSCVIYYHIEQNPDMVTLWPDRILCPLLLKRSVFFVHFGGNLTCIQHHNNISLVTCALSYAPEHHYWQVQFWDWSMGDFAKLAV